MLANCTISTNEADSTFFKRSLKEINKSGLEIYKLLDNACSFSQLNRIELGLVKDFGVT